MMGESPLRRTQHQQQLNQAQQQHPHHHHHHQESTHLQPTNLRIIDKRSLVKDNGRVSYLLAFTSTNIKNSQQQQQQQQFTCWVNKHLQLYDFILKFIHLSIHPSIHPCIIRWILAWQRCLYTPSCPLSTCPSHNCWI